MVIDNSSAFRYDDDLGLAVSDDGLITERGPFAAVSASHRDAPTIDLRAGLLRQIEVMRPKVILCIGAPSALPSPTRRGIPNLRSLATLLLTFWTQTPNRVLARPTTRKREIIAVRQSRRAEREYCAPSGNHARNFSSGRRKASGPGKNTR
mgnify:CR=1 FL=1